MAKTLIIKGANYSAVALDQVTIDSDPVPCTGISLSASSLVFSSFIPQTITASLTPSDTTDALSWASSDPTVVTVSGGVVTPLKNGSAVITAACGSVSATCNVTVSIQIDLDANLTMGYAFSKQNDGAAISTNNTGGASILSGDTKHAYGTTADGGFAYPIVIPTGCTEIRVTVPNQNYKVTVQWVDVTQNSGLGTQIALCVGGDANGWTSTVPNGDRTLVPPEDANGFFLTIYPRNSAAMTQTELDEVTVVAIF